MAKIKKTKLKTKKANIPVDKMTARESHYVGAILEEVRSNFKGFGESLEIFRQKTDEHFEKLETKIDIVSEKSDATFEEVGKIKVEMSEMNMCMDKMDECFDVIDNRFDNVDNRLDNIEREVRSMRSDLNEMKTTLTKKVDVEYLKGLEIRLVRVERHLNLAMA